MTPHGRENPLRSATRAGRPTDTRQFARLEGPKTRVGPYEVVASIPSQSGLEIFAAHKLSPLGFVRRALLKRVRRDGPGFVEGRRRLFEEAQAIAFLEHPGVAALVDLGEDDRGIYMARELVDGVDLLHVTATLRSRGEALPFEIASFITSEITRALHHAHAAEAPDGRPLGITHQGVSAAHVLVARTGHVRLIGFSRSPLRAGPLDPQASATGFRELGFVAPEVLSGGPASAASDVYSAGILLFELLTGRACFKGKLIGDVVQKIVKNELRLERLDEEGVPRELRRVVERACQLEPGQRFANANDMANALDTWVMQSQLHAGPWILAAFCEQHGLIEAPGRWTKEPVLGPAPSQAGVETMPPPAIAMTDPPEPRITPGTASAPPAWRGVHTPPPPAAAPWLHGATNEPTDPALSIPPRGPTPNIPASVPPKRPSLEAPAHPEGPADPEQRRSVSPDPIPARPGGLDGLSPLLMRPHGASMPPDMQPPITQSLPPLQPNELIAAEEPTITRAPTAPPPHDPADDGTPPPTLDKKRVSRPPALKSLPPTAPPMPTAPAPAPRDSQGPISVTQRLPSPYIEPPTARTVPLSAPMDHIDDPAEIGEARTLPSVVSPFRHGASQAPRPIEPRTPDARQSRSPDARESRIPDSRESRSPSSRESRSPNSRESRLPAQRASTDPEGSLPPPKLMAPAWTGDLASTRPGDVLNRLMGQEASGTLELKAGSVWKRLTLRDGKPMALSSNVGLEGIGEQLVKNKLLTRLDLDKALRESPRGEDGLIDRLINAAVLTPEKLAPELGKNITDGLGEVFGWRQGSFNFAPGVVHPPTVEPALDLAAWIETRAKPVPSTPDATKPPKRKI